jgi:hypothetical protein
VNLPTDHSKASHIPDARHTPDYYVLKNVPWPWQLFVTLTFRGRYFPVEKGRKRLHAVLRDMAKKCGVPFERLMCFLRLEHGGIDERPHFHALLAGLPVPAVTNETCAFMLARWIKKGGGCKSKIELFDASKDGVGYVTKSPRKFSKHEDGFWYSDAILQAARSAGNRPVGDTSGGLLSIVQI